MENIINWELLNTMCEIHASNFIELTKEINKFKKQSIFINI